MLGGAAVLLLGAVGMVVALSAAQPAFACAAQWTAPPSGSPAPDGPPGASPRLGYVQPDLGKNHIPVGQSVQYPLCPPASGRHYNAANLGPIKAQVYGPEDQTVPQGWVHNLEHGGLVVLYRCPGPGCDDAGQAAFRQFYSSFPPSPICKLPVGTVGPVITRFDQMAYPVVALLWGQVLPMDTWNPDLVLAFFNQQAERHCRFRQTVTGGTTGDACVSFIDFRNRGLNLVAETILSDLTLGLNLSYTARKSFVGTRNGTSQFQLGFFGNFSMSAGRELGALGR